MQITIFGATGKVGRLVVAEALRRGHQVTAFTHRRSQEPANGLTICRGDIYDQASIAQALIGSDAVISTLGSWHTPQKDVLASAMRSIIPAMESRGITRIVTLTGDRANVPGDVPSLLDRLSHKLLSLLAPKVLDDGEEHIMLLSASRLDWTVLRSGIMRGSGSAAYRLTARPTSLLIPRVAVVRALVDLVEDYSGQSGWYQAAPFITIGASAESYRP